MNGIFNTPLLLYKIAGYLPMKDVGRLSLCSKTLQNKVSDYFILIFINRIREEFSILNPEFIIKNIKDSQSAKCAWMSYICLCALNQSKPFAFYSLAENMDWKALGELPPIALCKWLELISNSSDYISDNVEKLIATGLPLIWNRLKISEKPLFYEITAPILVKLLESSPSLGMKEELRPIITYFFSDILMHDDFCDMLRKSNNTDDILIFLLISFCVTDEEKIIEDIKQLCKEVGADYAGYMLSFAFQKILTLKRLKGLIRHKIHSVGKLNDLGRNAPHLYNLYTFNNPEYLEILRILLEAGEDPCLVDQFGESAIVSVLSWSKTNKEVLDLLHLFLEFKVDLKNIKYKGKNLLHLICVNRHIDSGEAVNLLLESGIPFNKTDNNNLSPFDYVIESYKNIESKKSETIKALISAGEVLYDKNLNEAPSSFNLYVACLIDHNLPPKWPPEKMLCFEDYPCPMNILLSTSLMKGHVKVAKYLLRNKRSVEPIKQVNVMAPLYYALKLKNKEERRKFALSIIKKINLEDIDGFCIEAIIDQIRDDYPLFKEITSLDSLKPLWKHIQKKCNSYLAQAINRTLAQGNILIFKEMFACIAQKIWKEFNPFRKCIRAENALELLPQLADIFPEGLSYYDSSISVSVIQELCRMIHLENNYEKFLYYCEIFVWIEGKMASWDEENRLKVLYMSFSSLIEQTPYGGRFPLYFNFSNLSPKLQNIFYEALSIQKFLTYTLKGGGYPRSSLELLYHNAARICPTMALWENVKCRLIKLDLKNIFAESVLKSLIRSLCNYDADYLEEHKEFFLVIQDMIKFVIKHGEINLVSTATFRPLHANAYCGGYLVEFLKSLGHPLDPQDEDGDTPLHEACHSGDYPAVVRLLRAGASRNIMNNKQQTPYQIAVGKKHFSIMIKFLEADFREKWKVDSHCTVPKL